MKNKFFMVATALIAMMATSCTKEIENPQQLEEIKHIPITIKANYDGDNTKVSYSESGNTISAKWESDDEILIAYDGRVSTLTISSGAGTASAIFSGEISCTHTPVDGSILNCYVKDKNSSALSIDGTDIVYTNSDFLNQDGTLEGAGRCNTYFGMAKYSTAGEIACAFGVNTSILKFNSIFAPEGVSYGDEATLTYKSGSTELAKATFTVGTNGRNNTIFMAVPAGVYSGAQTLVYKSGETTKTLTLSADHANFAVGQTFSKTGLIFGYINLATLDGDYTVQGVVKITGSPTTTRTISISEGAVVTLDNVTATTSGRYLYLRAIGDATVSLSGTNSLNGGMSIMHVVSGKTLTIQGEGSIESSVTYGGVIGSLTSSACGNIIINSGTIKATVTAGNAAGIGCVSSSGCGDITINDEADIELTGNNAAGIGTTNNGGTCGDILITGGKVKANGGTSAAGIGTGNASSTKCGSITISGGEVEAKGGTGAAGIGTSANTSNNNKCDPIEISEGIARVKAIKGNGANQCIGKGKSGFTPTVTIDGTTSWSAGTATTHFNFVVSTTTNTEDTWTLTPIAE